MKLSTQMILLAEYQATLIPLEVVAEKYYRMNKRNAYEAANRQAFDFPVFRLGNQKSPWLVKIEHLAEYIDKISAKAEEEHKKLNN